MKKLKLRIFLGERSDIWREFFVFGDMSFERFHNVVQVVMGWENCHLYEFKIKNASIGLPNEGFLDMNELDSRKTFLSDFIGRKGQKIKYIYDFGDSWDHVILVREISDVGHEENIPFCVGGEKSCPPEDCGGIFGYENLLEVRMDKEHPEYAELIVDWLGEDFDPEVFDVNEVNRSLANVKIC